VESKPKRKFGQIGFPSILRGGTFGDLTESSNGSKSSFRSQPVTTLVAEAGEADAKARLAGVLIYAEGNKPHQKAKCSSTTC
jgi:hypothetical protein